MARLLFWILLVAAGYAVARGLLRAGGGRAPADARPPETMVRCAACGLNVPQSEAHPLGGQWYCSREHLERAQAAR
jgi:uncharacterized protein